MHGSWVSVGVLLNQRDKGTHFRISQARLLLGCTPEVSWLDDSEENLEEICKAGIRDRQTSCDRPTPPFAV